MSYTVEELNPRNPVLIIDNKEIELSLITLHIEVIFKETYGSLSKAFEKIKDKPTEIIDIIWLLVINKKQFDFSIESFKNFALTSKESIVDWSKSMSACLNESVAKSMPLIKNEKRHKEIQEIKNATNDQTPCYATYYDAIAKRYGYTLEQFYQLTLRQLHMFLNTIGDESYKELEVQASLHGLKLKPRIDYKDVSPEQEKEQDEAAMEAFKRLQKEYQEKKDK